MDILKNKFIIALFLLSFFPFFSKAEDQINIQENDIIVSVSPENPEPYQKTTINITSYSMDLNRAMISWQRGSEIVLSGYGKTSYSFDGGGPDTSIIFDIKINNDNLITPITKRVFVSFSEIIVLWEAVNSYTPPFYKGKSFVSKNGKIKAVAIPNTNTTKSNEGNFSYLWSVNGETENEISGYGQNYIIINNNYLNNEEKLKVTATSISGQYGAIKEITIPIVSPFMIFYKRSTEDGVLYNNGSTSEFSAENKENTITVEPYFLEYKNLEGDFVYEWKINNQKIETPSKKRELTFRPTSMGGYANIEVQISHITKIFQKVGGLLKLNL